MKRTILCLCFIGVIILAACNQPQEPAAVAGQAEPGIEGVWTHVETEQIGGPDEGRSANPQPSLVFITKNYYCSNFISAAEPRPALNTQTPTPDQMAQAYQGFISAAGPYELRGSTIILHPSVSIEPDLMYGGSLEIEYKLDGDTLILTMDPAKIKYSTYDYKPPYTESRFVLKRLE